jgi:hypothetical protein
VSPAAYGPTSPPYNPASPSYHHEDDDEVFALPEPKPHWDLNMGKRMGCDWYASVVKTPEFSDDEVRCACLACLACLRVLGLRGMRHSNAPHAAF